MHRLLDLIADVVERLHPDATALLEVGCGAGNYSLKLLERLPKLQVTLVDLSQPMLTRAKQRITTIAGSDCEAIQGDIREIKLGEQQFDVIVAAAVLHHLRTTDEWNTVFCRLYAALKPGGSLWISDLIEHSTSAVQELMWHRYGQYLTELKDEQYRDQVFAYVE